MYFVIIEHTQTSHRVLYAGRPSTALVAAIVLAGFLTQERSQVTDLETMEEILDHYATHSSVFGDEYAALHDAWMDAKAGVRISLHFGPAVEGNDPPA